MSRQRDRQTVTMTSPHSASEQLVSAVIPAYNAAATIRRAIDSILAQSYPRVEVIVVDDGSTDGTAQVVRDSYPQVKLITQENAGPCAARNRGVAEASGELIAFLDSDDEWTPDKLQLQVQTMRAHPEIDMLGTNGWRTVGEMRYLAMPTWPPGRKLSRTHITDIFSPRHLMANSVLVKREVFESLGGFDTGQKRYEDLDFVCRAIDAGYQVYCLDEPTYVVHVRPESRSNQRALGWLILAGRMPTLRKLDPRNHPPDRPGALTPREHSRVMGEQIALAARDLLASEDGLDGAIEALDYMRELAMPSVTLRILRWCAHNDEALFRALLPAYGRWLTFNALRKVCGVGGALRRRQQSHAAAALLRGSPV